MITALQELQTGMLKSKIMELQSALFFTESASLVKLPTHVISDVDMNEEEIWFLIPRPAQHIDAFDKEIPAKLDFFKKGMDFFVKVEGTAFIVTDQEELAGSLVVSDAMRERMMDRQLIAVKVRIQEANLVDNAPKPSNSWFQGSRSQLSSWFF